jgi:hypothetical protein
MKRSRIMGAGLACIATLTLASTAAGEDVREWSYAGTVGSRFVGAASEPCLPGSCGGFDDILPMGSPITMDIAFDHDAIEDPTCAGFYPGAVTSLQFSIGGQSFTTGAYTWVGAYGFAGACGPATTGLELVTPGVYEGTLPGTVGQPRGRYITGGFAGLSGASAGWRDALPAVLAFAGPEIWLSDADGLERLTFTATLQRTPSPIPAPIAAVLLATGVVAALARTRRS